ANEAPHSDRGRWIDQRDRAAGGHGIHEVHPTVALEHHELAALRVDRGDAEVSLRPGRHRKPAPDDVLALRLRHRARAQGGASDACPDLALLAGYQSPDQKPNEG